MTEFKTLREKIAAEKAEREARYSQFTVLWREAWLIGEQAAMAHKPRTMVVSDSDGTMVDIVPEGMCGFAWLNVPGNTSFGRWLKKQRLARPDYPTGLCVWISSYSQSYERKVKHAVAMASYLRDNGIECRVGSRLD
jgi:hypothetical protein